MTVQMKRVIAQCCLMAAGACMATWAAINGLWALVPAGLLMWFSGAIWPHRE